MPTPTQAAHRPFFSASISSFLAAFRAHSSSTASATLNTSKSASLSTTTSSSHSQSNANASTSREVSHSQARSIGGAHADKTSRTNASMSTGNGATSAALREIHSPRSTGSSPLSTSPNPGFTTSSTSPYQSQARERERFRRGSDSSNGSEGFRDVLGAEKWYIGGRTAAGEERFFKLGVVRRERSVDRLSCDRLSL